jgi:hypothetical protein
VPEPEPAPARTPFAYALLRVVPRVERGERVNVGVALYCRQCEFLNLRTHVDEARLRALAPELELAAVRTQLQAISNVLCGDPQGGALAKLPPSERFGWLVAPSSTIIQPSAVHTGLTHDPAASLQQLFASLVL